MECGRAGTASAAAEPVRAPARRAGSSAKWAAFHSSMQPESCRFNRTPALGVVAEYGETVESLQWSRQFTTRCMITEALVPPKPNEFDSATLISRERGFKETRSIAVSTDGLSRLMVGGAMLSRMARM